MTKKSNGDKITCHFAIEYETKNTVRYHAVTPDGKVIEDNDIPVKTLYLNKTTFDPMPDKLVMTIEKEE